ncbi:MAG: DUF2007 domain-containing protein [Hellea sp.]
MICVIRTMNPATHSFAEAILKDAGIEHFRFDFNSSIMDGYTATIPRRLMVIDDDAQAAREALIAAGLGDEIAKG